MVGSLTGAVSSQKVTEEYEGTLKARLKSVVDGKQVNIPVPILDAMWGRRRLGQPSVGIGGLSV